MGTFIRRGGLWVLSRASAKCALISIDIIVQENFTNLQHCPTTTFKRGRGEHTAQRRTGIHPEMYCE
jgi:hypothetical protein